MNKYEEISFLSTSQFTAAYLNDPVRVRQCLVHKFVDVRLAAVKCMVFNTNSLVVSELITTFATHNSWRNGGIYPASKLVAPFVCESNGKSLADAFPELAERNETGYQVLCKECKSSHLAAALEKHLFADDSSEETCHLAIKSLTAVKGLDQTALWSRCLGHRFAFVVQCARRYLIDQDQ